MQAGGPGRKPAAMMGSGMPTKKEMRKGRRKLKKDIAAGALKKKADFLEPNKELMFGNVKKMQTGDTPEGRVQRPTGRRRAPIDDTRRGATSSEAAARRRQETADAAAARRGASREEKQNTGQGSSAKNQSGSPRTNTVSGGPAKGTYAYAKKQNPNIDALIKRRKTLTKGTPEYNKIQNQINKAYGRGPTTRDTTPTKKIAPKTVKQVPTSKSTPTIKTPAKPAAPAANKPQDRRTTTVRFQSKADDRKARRASNKSGRQAVRAGRKAGRLKKRLEKLEGKMMYGGKKMGMGGYNKMMSYQPGGEKKKTLKGRSQT